MQVIWSKTNRTIGLSTEISCELQPRGSVVSFNVDSYENDCMRVVDSSRYVSSPVGGKGRGGAFRGLESFLCPLN